MQQRNETSIWEKAPMLRILIAFIIGVMTYDFFVPAPIKASFIILPFILGFGVLFALSKNGKHPTASIIFTLLTVAILGFGCSYFNDVQQSSFFFGNHQEQSKSTLAVVNSEGAEKGKTVKYEVAFLKSFGDSGTETIIGNGFLYIYKDSSKKGFHLGDTLLLPNRWESIGNGGNPFEMNYQKFCARKNIHFQQFIALKEILVYARFNKNNLSFIKKTNQYCIDAINQNIKDSNTNALLKAMLLGDERDIDPNIREAYSDTGIIHIISISGAHVAILFGTIGLLFKKLKTRKHLWIKMSLSLILIWFYVLLAGASTPALRAAIMFSVMIIGEMSKQRSNQFNQLFTAAFILLLVNPAWLFTIGFQLSFTAVLSLMIFYQPIASLYSSSYKIVQFIINAFAASIAAEILVAPLVAYYFHSFPPMFIVANLLASTAMSFVLILGMMLLLFAQIKFLATLFSSIIILITHLFHYLIILLQQISIDNFKTIYVSTLGLIVLFLFIAYGAHFLLRKHKQSLWTSLFILLLFSIIHIQRSWDIFVQHRLIVYNQNGTAQIELIKGNKFKIISGEQKESYSTKNAHIGLGASLQIPQASNYLFVFKNRKILLLDSNDVLPNSFPVDVLIIKSWEQKVNVEKLIKTFSPQQIVIANNIKKRQTNEWLEQCTKAKIPLHDTKKDAAFIFPY